MRALLRHCVERPLGVLAIYVGSAVVAVFAARQLPQELMPDLRFPQLSITTALPNASPEEVENLVTRPLERALGTVKDVRSIESRSREQASVIDLQFRWETDMDAAPLWVQEKIGLILDTLPIEAKKPVISRHNPFDRPVIVLAVTGRRPLDEIDRLIRIRLRPALDRISGVAGVSVSGGKEREISVELDAQRLLAHRLAVPDVAESVRRQNVSRSAGAAHEGLFEYPITVTGLYRGAREIGDTIVRSERDPASESAVRLSSLGRVVDGFRESTRRARYDGRDNIAVSIFKRAEAYPLEVSADVRRALEAIRRQMPKDVRIDIVNDQSLLIQEGVRDVAKSVLFGGLLAYVVLWLFLRSHRRALIVGLAIPLALGLTLTCFWYFDMTLNLLTLGGLALGVGMLVDASVVIVESIARRLEAGQPTKEAIIEGGGDVGAPVVFSVLTVLAAFAPIPFATVGVAQRVFTPIAVAVMISQTMSVLIGFTFLPALATLLLEPRRGTNDGRRGFAPLFGNGRRPRLDSLIVRWRERRHRWMLRAKNWEGSALEALLRRPSKRSAWAATAIAVCALGAGFLPKEIMPDLDQHQIVARLVLPMGTRLEATDRVARSLEKIFQSFPEVAHCSSVVGAMGREDAESGSNEAELLVDLTRGGTPRPRRTARQVMAAAREALREEDLEGGRVVLDVLGENPFSQIFSRRGADATVEIRASGADALAKASNDFVQRLKSRPGLQRIDFDESIPAPQLRYDMDEARLSQDGLTVADVAESVLAAVHGVTATVLRENALETPVRVRLREEDRNDVSALERLFLPSPLERSEGHPLSEYGRMEIVAGPSEILRRDQRSLRRLAIHFRAGEREAGRASLQGTVADFASREDVAVSLDPDSAELYESLRSFWVGGMAAVGLVFIALVAQFNTLWLPLVALVAFPLSLIGVVPALWISGGTLNLMSAQGLMILSGIVVNNAIVLLDSLRKERGKGCSAEDSVRRAVQTRRRPILMTASTTVIGLFPLALGLGSGSEIQSPMAVTVIAGLVASTLLTLYVLPAFYLVAEKRFETRGIS